MRNISIFLVICVVLGFSTVAFAASVKKNQHILIKNPAGSTKEPIIPVIPEDDDPEPSYIPVTYSEPVYIPPPPPVTTPDASTLWEHGDRNCRVEWNGLDGDLIKIEIYKGGVLLEEFSGWENNTGSFTRYTAIPSSWGSGMGFQIVIEDNLGNTLTSETFRIMAPIHVSQPGLTTTWSYAEKDVQITWSGSPGNSVDIVLFDEEYQVATLASGISNTGSFTYPGEVSFSWGTGDNYSVRITDDIGNEYNSRNFTINAINVTSPEAGTVWSDHNPILNISWEGGSRVIRTALYIGSAKIKDLTEWIDNTGSCEIGDFLSYNLEAGSNYMIEVRDDQGNQGFSQTISVSYSQCTQQGAVQTSGNSIENTLPPNESMYFSTNLPSGHYRISIDADEDLEVSFQRSNGSHIEDITSSQNNIYIASSTRLIRVSNSSSNENTFKIGFIPLHEKSIAKHHFFLDLAIALPEGSASIGGGVGGAYYYNVLRNIDVGLSHTMQWCTWGLPDSLSDEFSEYRLDTTCFSTLYTPSISGGLSAICGIGYSKNTVSIDDYEYSHGSGELIDTNLLNKDGFTAITGIRYSESSGYSARFFWRYCIPSKSSTFSITLGIIGFNLGSNVYVE